VKITELSARPEVPISPMKNRPAPTGAASRSRDCQIHFNPSLQLRVAIPVAALSKESGGQPFPAILSALPAVLRCRASLVGLIWWAVPDLN
jgi:hypothetical protein